MFTTTCSSVECYYRLFVKDGEFYVYCSEYTRLSKRNQSVVKYRAGQSCKFGFVKYFAQLTDATGVNRNVAFIHNLHVTSTLCHGAVHTVRHQSDTEVVPIVHILSTCIFMHTASGRFVCEIPNRFDRD